MFGLGTLDTTTRDLATRYRHWRAVSKNLNHKVMKHLSGEDMDQGGAALGILKNNILVFDSEDEMAVLMDYCLYNIRREGKTARERYAECSEVSEDERVILQSMAASRFSLFKIDRADGRGGLEIEDLLYGEKLLLMDMNMSMTAKPGSAVLLASRLIPMEDFWMTGGAGVPVSGDAKVKLRENLEKWVDEHGEAWDDLPDELESKFTRMVLKTCLHETQTGRIEYGDVEDTPEPPLRRGEKIGRNDPCPCGSGSKYKKCCGRGA